MAATERLEALAAVIERAAADIDALAAQAGEAETRLTATPGDKLVAYGAGAVVHGFYTELEKVFQRVARELDGFEPRGDAWHTDLLAEMSVDIPATRPPVIPDDVQKRLHEYLRFRHLFRNLYVLDLEAPRVRDLLARMPSVWTDVRASFIAFAAALRTVARGVRDAGPGTI